MSRVPEGFFADDDESFPSRQSGEAPVGFVMVLPLVLATMLALLGLAMALHARMIIQDSAAEGARSGSYLVESGAPGIETAEARTRELITAALPEEYAEGVSATVANLDGVDVIRVQVTAPIPILGFAGPRMMVVSSDVPIE